VSIILVSVNLPIQTFTNKHGQNIGDNPQDAVFAENEGVETIVEYPTKPPGVASDTGDAELTRVDPDFDVKPTGVEMDSEAQGYVQKSTTRLMALNNKIQLKTF
jgi:hypothetical protein